MTLDGLTRVPEFLSEVLQQNWRLDLDAGLGIEEPVAENILIVCSREVANKLFKVFNGDSSNEFLIAVLKVEGTQAGDSSQYTELKKKVISVAQSLGKADAVKI